MPQERLDIMWEEMSAFTAFMLNIPTYISFVPIFPTYISFVPIFPIRA